MYDPCKKLFWLCSDSEKERFPDNWFVDMNYYSQECYYASCILGI